MIVKSGNLFDTDAMFIGHGVNTHGLMGAGIAREFRTRFPKNYALYKKFCDNKSLVPGKVFAFSENGMTIFNMATQDNPGQFARYEWVESAADHAVRVAHAIADGPTKIAVPAIGCGIGGLDWNRVGAILETTEAHGIEWEVWFL